MRINNCKKIIDANPQLTAFGWQSLTDDNYAKNRQQLIENQEQIETCLLHLFRFGIPDTQNSYGAKHVIERAYTTYISNGAYIVAALALGIEFSKTIPPNSHH